MFQCDPKEKPIMLWLEERLRLTNDNRNNNEHQAVSKIVAAFEAGQLAPPQKTFKGKNESAAVLRAALFILSLSKRTAFSF